VRNGTDGRDALVAVWPRLAGGKTRVVVMPISDGNGASASAVLGKGLPFITAARLQRSFNHPGIWCRQHGAQQGQLVGSRRREYSCGKRWRSDVMASHGRNTDDDEVQQSNELIVMGKNEKNLVYNALRSR
jgi:hypothetical protein